MGYDGVGGEGTRQGDDDINGHDGNDDDDDGDDDDVNVECRRAETLLVEQASETPVRHNRIHCVTTDSR